MFFPTAFVRVCSGVWSFDAGTCIQLLTALLRFRSFVRVVFLPLSIPPIILVRHFPARHHVPFSQSRWCADLRLGSRWIHLPRRWFITSFSRESLILAIWGWTGVRISHLRYGKCFLSILLFFLEGTSWSSCNNRFRFRFRPVYDPLVLSFLRDVRLSIESRLVGGNDAVPRYLPRAISNGALQEHFLRKGQLPPYSAPVMTGWGPVSGDTREGTQCGSVECALFPLIIHSALNRCCLVTFDCEGTSMRGGSSLVPSMCSLGARRLCLHHWTWVLSVLVGALVDCVADYL
ncbi:hypothetical protein DFP72DRAFT_293956 [Ephemerocybe angulata]|uniref:Uncharacterized protein n=1 Tax=Ephemerocybe angulata TaxID=980116 RepID=A0A8H6M579_9AGAR|nr:hypothetical protein DFP72DRAFT_293956 [Tulosesus angulatus]